MLATAVRAATFQPVLFGSDEPSRIELAVIVATFREAGNIALLIDRLKRGLSSNGTENLHKAPLTLVGYSGPVR